MTITLQPAQFPFNPLASLHRLASDAKFLLLQWTGKLPSQTLRHWLYRQLFGLSLGQRSVIYNSCHIRAPQKVQIGDFTSIGDQCVLDGRGG
jgi:hypothetical protein